MIILHIWRFALKYTTLEVVIGIMRRIMGIIPQLNGLYVAIIFGSTITVTSVLALSKMAPSDYKMNTYVGSSRTLGLAPLSIGNPIAAVRGIETLSPNTPNNNFARHN